MAGRRGRAKPAGDITRSCRLRSIVDEQRRSSLGERGNSMNAVQLRSSVLTFVSSVLVSTVAIAEAGTITTSRLSINPDGGDSIRCEVANPTSGPVNITIDILDFTGKQLATSGPIVLGAGRSTQFEFSPPMFDALYCAVVTNNAGVRVAMNRFNGTSSDLKGWGQIARSGGTVTTAPLYISGGDGVLCEIVNVGLRPISIQVDIVDGNGQSVDSQTFNVAAGGTAGAGVIPEADGLYRCEVTTTSSVRVSLSRSAGLPIVDANGYGEVR